MSELLHWKNQARISQKGRKAYHKYADAQTFPLGDTLGITTKEKKKTEFGL